MRGALSWSFTSSSSSECAMRESMSDAPRSSVWIESSNIIFALTCCAQRSSSLHKETVTRIWNDKNRKLSRYTLDYLNKPCSCHLDGQVSQFCWSSGCSARDSSEVTPMRRQNFRVFSKSTWLEKECSSLRRVVECFCRKIPIWIWILHQ